MFIQDGNFGTEVQMSPGIMKCDEIIAYRPKLVGTSCNACWEHCPEFFGI